MTIFFPQNILVDFGKENYGPHISEMHLWHVHADLELIKKKKKPRQVTVLLWAKS